MRCLILLFFLSGCVAGDIATAKALTFDDGVSYVRENHDWRREIRSTRYGLVRKIFHSLDLVATAHAANGDHEKAAELWMKADDVLRSAYPELATIKAIREGISYFEELRELGDSQ